MSEPREDAYCELSFSPNVSLVSTVRKFVTSFYAEVLADADATSKLAVATHELLENAVRYASDDLTSLRIGVRRDGSHIAVKIDTRNHAAPADVETLKRMVGEVASATDAAAHYQTLMRRASKRDDGSGLGLGRIRAETDMAISLDVEGNTVHLQATAQFEVRKST